MKASVLLIIFTFFTMNAFAYDYSCVSTDENEPYNISKISVRTNGSTVDLKFEGFDNVETYTVSEYKPRNSTKSSLKLSLVLPAKNSYGEGYLPEFFAEKELATGGYTLRNGKTGGFIKVSGWGYSWANYVCFRTK